MADLRDLVQPLLDDPPIEPTPVVELRRRARHRRNRIGVSAASLLLACSLVGALVIVTGRRPTKTAVSTRPDVAGPVGVSILQLGGATDVAIGSNAVWAPAADVVRRVDPDANAVSATIPVAGTSDLRSVTTAFGAAWVTDTGTGELTRIDEATNQVVARIEIGGGRPRE
jgi:streptogramin lyase